MANLGGNGGTVNVTGTGVLNAGSNGGLAIGGGRGQASSVGSFGQLANSGTVEALN